MRGWSRRPAIYYFIIYSPQTNSPHLHSGLPCSLRIALSLVLGGLYFATIFPSSSSMMLFGFSRQRHSLLRNLYTSFCVFLRQPITHSHTPGGQDRRIYITSDVWTTTLHCTWPPPEMVFRIIAFGFSHSQTTLFPLQ